MNELVSSEPCIKKYQDGRFYVFYHKKKIKVLSRIWRMRMYVERKRSWGTFVPQPTYNIAYHLSYL
jgi:hypothetical protein